MASPTSPSAYSPRGGGQLSPSQAPNVQVYQIDFTAAASGKRIASSKRRVRWRFGFANPEALANGETGTACRGEEHDVTLVWSITSGKRLVLADGQEVHYSNSRSGIFDFSWTMRGNHILKIVAHASPPLSPTPGWRQYDFFVDGRSFFSFPKVFRLGLAPNDPRATATGAPTRLAERGERRSVRSGGSASGVNIASIEAPNNPDEEEAYLQEAIRQSLDDTAPKTRAMSANAASGGGGGDLLDFGVANPPAAVAPAGDPFAAPPPAALPASTGPFDSQPAPVGGFADPFAAPAITSSASYGYPTYPTPAAAGPLPALPAPVPAATTNGYGPGYPPPAAAPAPTMNGGYGQTTAPAPTTTSTGYSAGLAPPAPATGFGAPAPASQYGSAYSASAPAASFSGPAPISTQSYGAGSPAIPPQVTPQAHQTPSTLGFSSPPADFSGFSPQPVAEPPAAPAPQQAPAPAQSVPMSMYSAGAEAPATGSTADQAYAKLVNMDNFSVSKNTGAAPSNPFDLSAGTTTSSVVGTQSLADIQSKKTSASGATKEIMKAPAAGAMVVSGNQSGNWGGQYGVQQQQPMQQPGGAYGGMQPAYGQQPMQQQMPYGQQPQYGQAPQQPMSYGQAPPPPMQQQYGQAPAMGQPQQPSYGQPPPPQQQYF